MPRHIPVIIFLLALAAPVSTDFMIGSFRISIYRIVLFSLIFPCAFMILSRRVGKLDSADYFVLLFATWPFISLTALHGWALALEPAGIFFIEAAGSYFLARCFIRNSSDFRNAVKTYFTIILVLIPFTIYESFTGHQLLQLGGPGIGSGEQRLGLFRALGPFDHQILYGVYCAAALGIVFYCLQGMGRGIMPILRGSAIFLASFFSLSTGPLVAYIFQLGLIIWDFATRRIRKRWNILLAILLFCYVSVELLSNRSTVEVFISYFTFNPGNSYMRILIWQYGTASVMNHPILGIGLGDWERAFFMSGTMDNFWLLNAVRYGLPGFLFLAGAFLLRIIKLGRLRIKDPMISAFRKGWIITMIGLAVAGATVHYWDAVFCLFMFLLGSSEWMSKDRNRTRAST